MLLSLSVPRLQKNSDFAGQTVRLDFLCLLLFSFSFLGKLCEIGLTLEKVIGVALIYLITVNCSNLLSRF